MGTNNTTSGVGVQSLVEGTNISVDDTDPANPIVGVAGLGTAALADTSDFATAAQGNTADAAATGLANHLSDATDAHDASAISYAGGTGISATDVEGALDELATEKANVANAALTGAPTAPTAAPGDADTTIATTAFVADAVASAVAGLFDYRGGYDASGNVFPSSGGSGAAGAVLRADAWIVTVAGTLGGKAVGVGDLLIAEIDTPGQTAANWSDFELNLGYVPENAANKSNDATMAASSATLYPSQAAAKTYVDGKVAQTITDGVTTSAPSQDAVFDALATKANLPAAATPPAGTYYEERTYAVLGDGSAATVFVPFAVRERASDTLVLDSVVYRCSGGTPTIKLQVNGADATGFTAIAVSSVQGETNPADVSLADKNEISVVCTAGSWTGWLYVTILLKRTVA